MHCCFTSNNKYTPNNKYIVIIYFKVARYLIFIQVTICTSRELIEHDSVEKC